MELIKKNITTLLLAVLVIVVTAMIYAPMYAYQEGMQIFMFGSDFFAETCSRPGGLSDYIGCFLVQFFMYPVWIAAIFIVVVVGVQWVTKKIFSQYCPESWADLLSVLCASGMMLAVVNFNTMFGGIVAIALAVLMVKITDLTKNAVILTLATPLVYWAVGGCCCLIYIIGIALCYDFKKGSIVLGVNALLLVFTALITKKIMQDDSLVGTFVGVDYNRIVKTTNYSWFISVAIICVCWLLSKINVKIDRLAFQIPLYAAVLGGLIAWTSHKYDKLAMLDYKIDKMVRYKQWTNIVSTMSGLNYSSYQAQCYLNVALNELGIMDKKMFDVPQIGTEGLLSEEMNSTNKSIYNSEIFFRLGLINISERLAVESVEANDTHQKSARQYKRLAEISIIRNDKPLAMRYLKLLQKTVFYRAWADRAVEYLDNPAQTEALADWKMKPLEMTEHDIFYSPATKSDFLLNLLANNPHSQKLLNYYVGYLLLEKNIKRVYDFLARYQPEGEMGVPVYEALLLYHFFNNKQEFDKIMSSNNDLTKRFQQFSSFMSSPNAQDVQKAKELFGKTYWFYYSFVQPSKK